MYNNGFPFLSRKQYQELPVMPFLDKNGHVVKPKSEQLQPQAEDAPDKESLELQPSMVGIGDSFSEIAKVMQDRESEAQESMKI